MKKLVMTGLAAATLAVMGSLFSSDKAAEPTKEVSQEQIDKLSEAFGHFIGRSLKSPALMFNVDNVIKGIKEGASGAPAPMTDKEYEAGMMALQEQMFHRLSQENLQAANQFLETNGKKSGVVSVEDGKLQYLTSKEGQGDTVATDGHPKINYKGQFLDGEVFGSSDDTGAITLDLSHTIPGFKKGITGMKEGEKRTLYIHPDLGYGVTGQLPPNSLLIFDVEVLKADDPKSGSLSMPDDDLDIEEFDMFDNEEPSTPSKN